MLNVMIADDSLPYVQGLINHVIGRHLNIKIIHVASDGLEVLNILKQNATIDLILLDLQMPKLDGIATLDKICDLPLTKYPKVMVISGYADLIAKIVNHPLVIDFINKSDNINNIYNKIENYEKELSFSYIQEDLIQKITDELSYIGYNPAHLGTKYIRECILEIYKTNNSHSLCNLEKYLYPKVGCMHNKSVQNIKINITKATDSMYLESDMNVVKDYFHFSDNKRKPTPKIVISTILNKL